MMFTLLALLTALLALVSLSARREDPSVLKGVVGLIAVSAYIYWLCLN